MFYPDYGPTTKYLSGVIDDRTNYQNIRFEYRPRNWTDDGSNVGRNSLFIRSEIPIDTDKVFIKFFKRKNRRWRNISSLNFGYLHDESGRDSDIGTVIYSPIGKLEPAEVVVHKEKKVYERVISNKLYKVQVPAYFVFAGPDMEERHVSVPLGDFDVCAQMFLTTFSPRNKGGHTWYYD